MSTTSEENVEVLDILTADGKMKTGKASRRVVHSRGLWHRTVHVWILNNRDELLLQRRAAKKETHPGLLDVSCAGHVGAGDSSRETVLKELKEELGISLDERSLRLLCTLTQQYLSRDNGIIDNEITDVFLCTRRFELSDITIDPAEVEEVLVFNTETLQRQRETRPEKFVPHDEEYRVLFSELDRSDTYL